MTCLNGHGMIVTERTKGVQGMEETVFGVSSSNLINFHDLSSPQVDEAASRRWWKRFNPWMTKDKNNMDPHQELKLFAKCSVCGRKKTK